MPVIEFAGVTKEFRTVTAVEDVDLSIRDGEVFALVGPNGSGKSTLLNVLLGLVQPTRGSASLCGHDTATDPRAARRRLGVVPEGYGVYDRLTGRRHVQFAASSRGVEADPVAVLERVGLADVADRRAGGYSAGMTKRLVLALALVGRPDVLILDEPFYGLDPDASATLRDVIRTERDRGATILFTTHLFSEVRALADRVGMLADGRLVRVARVDAVTDGEESAEALEAVFHEAVAGGAA